VLLASPPGKLRTREELIDRVWTNSELADTRSLDKHIRRLRTRIELNPKKPRHLKTIHGVGFRLDNP
jgi:two-component system response regulator RegX3